MATAWRPDVPQVIADNQTANGLAVIITNSYEGSQCRRLEPLLGTKSDGDRMKESFLKLNFSICRHHNLSKEATMQLLYSAATYEPFPPSYRRVAFVFSGHGAADHTLYTGEGDTMKVSDILMAFFPERAPRNGNIAKLFFIDACRGKQTNSGVIVPRSGREIKTLTVPKHGNFLVAYSTTPDHLSYEERAKGGIWITSLADKLGRKNASVHDILVEVNSELVSKYQKSSYANYVQQPEFISRLNESVNLYKEAKVAMRSVIQDSDSDMDKDLEEMGYVNIDPKSDFTSSLPATLDLTTPRPRANSAAAGVQRVLQKAFKFKFGGRSHSLNESSLASPQPQNHSPISVSHDPLPPSCPLNSDLRTPTCTPYMRTWQNTGSPKEKLERYCLERGKPSPHFDTVKMASGKYKSTVYVAKTCGRVTGEPMRSKWEAERNAAELLLRKLQL